MRLNLGRGTLEQHTYFSDVASRQLWTPHIAFTIDKAAETRRPSTHFRAYGLGWSLSDYHGRLVVGHGGAADGMFSRLALLPDERLGVVILSNSDSELPEALVNHVIDVYLRTHPRDWSAELLERSRQRRRDRAAARDQAERSRLSGTRPSLPLEAYAGTYASDLYGDARVSIENGRPVLRLLANPQLVADLTHWHLDTFALAWRRRFPWFGGGRVQFVLDERARVTQLKLDVPNDDFWFWEPEFLRR
jgi:hypothetical protein